jgi:hypothetical protein
MRSRAIDIALLLGLVAVAGAIMWTLFSLGGQRSSPTPATRPPDQTAPVAPGDPARVVPVSPGPAEDAPADAPADAPPPASPPTAPAIAGDDADDDADEDEADVGEAPVATPAEPAEPAEPAPAPPGPLAGQPEGGADAAPPVPAGTVDIERIGFSFVTGGPGACGVVLEAWTHVAVSRELLAAYGCGARVRVTLSDAAGERSEFEGVVGDTMNPVFARTLNVYVGEDEPALEYGLTTGTITPLDPD